MLKNIIDLRSDTVTKPSDEMRKAIYEAEVGDDVYKEDPTVNKLEEFCADLFKKEAALFVPSGVMGNQICLNVQTNPSDEVFCEKDAHIFQYESGTSAALSGIQLCQIEGKNGVYTADQVEPLIRPESAYYMPRSKGIAVENTHNRAGGTINPIENIAALKQLAEKHNMFMHLDGARLWNAHAATGIPLEEYAGYFNSLSVCLSKGLGAPMGSVILGDKDFVTECFRVRKRWGGGMRQLGMMAAAGIYAIKNNLSKLAEDHEKAKAIANNLAQFNSIEFSPELVHTNILTFKPLEKSAEQVIKEAEAAGLIVSLGNVGWVRIVTHLDASFEDVKKANEILTNILGK